MPYGSTSKPETGIHSIRCTDTGGGLWTPIDKAYSLNVISSSRSGTNSSIKLPVSQRYTVEKVPYLAPVVVPKGPRLPYKIRLKDGRTVWARKPITVYRIKYRKKRKYKSLKGLSLPPNALNFTKMKVTYIGSPIQTWKGVNPTYPKQTYSVTGNLLSNYDGRPYGLVAKAVSGGLQTYANTSFSLCNSTVESRVADKALKALYARCKNQKVNMAQAFGERRQTAQLIGDIIVRVAKAVKQAKKLNVKGAVSTLLPKGSKGLANDWLAYQYGVKPLLSDVKGAAEHLAGVSVDQVTNGQFFDIVVARTEKLPLTTLGSVVNNHWSNTTTTAKAQGKVTVKYKLRFKITNSALKSASELGLVNLPALAWELAPWSFIVDWALPIGDKLNSLDAMTGLTFVHGHKTVIYEEDIHLTRRYHTSSSNGLVGPQLDLQCVISKFKCVRSILSSPPAYPSLAFKDPISDSHIANAMALLRQLKK